MISGTAALETCASGSAGCRIRSDVLSGRTPSLHQKLPWRYGSVTQRGVLKPGTSNHKKKTRKECARKSNKRSFVSLEPISKAATEEEWSLNVPRDLFLQTENRISKGAPFVYRAFEPRRTEEETSMMTPIWSPAMRVFAQARRDWVHAHAAASG